MRKYIHILTLLLGVILTPYFSCGQLIPLGDAQVSASQCNCFEITQAVGDQVGGFYEDTPIDITSPFNLKFTVNFGDDNDAGEGLAFSLQAGGSFSLGTGRWGLGVEGVSNEIHIEFDTRYSHQECSCSNNDLQIDHLGLMKDGYIIHTTTDTLDVHGSSIAGATNLHPLIGGVSNVEDGLDHKVEIDYDGGSILTVTVDDIPQVFNMDGNTLSSHLGGATTARWGWTGSTPQATPISNSQSVCLANCNAVDYSLVSCQNIPMNFTSDNFSFYPIVDYNWYFPGSTPPGPINGQNVTHTFATPGTHIVVVESEDASGCTVLDTVEVGVGFDISTEATPDTVCPGTAANLSSEAIFFVPPTCTYTLLMGDAFCDGWSGSVINIYVADTLYSTESPPSVGCGGAGWEEFVFLDLPDGAEVVFEFDYGGNFGGEIYYQLYDPDSNLIIDVPLGSVNGSILDTFFVDCSLTAATYSYQWSELTPPTNPPNVAGPATPEWNNVMVDYPQGQFQVDITNNQTGCVVSEVLTVTTYDTASVILTGDATICEGECTDITFIFSGAPPYDLEYEINGSGTIVNGIMTSPYVVQVCEDAVITPTSLVANGCPGNVYGSATVIEIPLPDVSITGDATYCEGVNMNDLTVTSNNGGKVFWWVGTAPSSPADTLSADGSGNTFNPNPFVNATTTIYAQEFSVPEGCGGVVDEVTLTILPVPTAPPVIGATEYCDGDTYTALSVSPAPSGTIYWTDGSNTIDTGNSWTPSNLVVGVPNIFYAKEFNGTCFGDSTLITITLKPTPVAPGISGDTTYCSGNTPTALTAVPNIGGTITWSDGSTGNTLIPTLVVGQVTYCANETLNGCTGPDSCVIVTTYVDPTITIPSALSICIGDSVEVCAENNGIFPPDLIQWSHGPTDECVYLGPLVDQQYTVCLTNPACGTSCDTVDVTVFDLPIIEAGDDQTTGLGGEVTMWADGGIDYAWSPSVQCQSSNCNSVYVVPSETTVYEVIGTDENGCKNSANVLITIDGEMQVYIPNVFSPDGNGNNDLIHVMGPRLTNFEFKIFDRWGRKLFETTDQNVGWNGELDGKPIPQQVVTYVLTGTDVLGRAVKRGGDILLAR